MATHAHSFSFPPTFTFSHSDLKPYPHQGILRSSYPPNLMTLASVLCHLLRGNTYSGRMALNRLNTFDKAADVSQNTKYNKRNQSVLDTNTVHQRHTSKKAGIRADRNSRSADLRSRRRTPNNSAPRPYMQKQCTSNHVQS